MHFNLLPCMTNLVDFQPRVTYSKEAEETQAAISKAWNFSMMKPNCDDEVWNQKCHYFVYEYWDHVHAISGSHEHPWNSSQLIVDLRHKDFRELGIPLLQVWQLVHKIPIDCDIETSDGHIIRWKANGALVVDSITYAIDEMCTSIFYEAMSVLYSTLVRDEVPSKETYSFLVSKLESLKADTFFKDSSKAIEKVIRAIQRYEEHQGAVIVPEEDLER